jgi:hypothetical protein
MTLLDLLAGAGDVLDTPGRLVRTGLAGKNPFDALFDPSQGVSGRQLLEQYGLVGANEDQGWMPDAGDVGGFAAEMALDPTNLIGGGLLAKLLGKSRAATRHNAEVRPLLERLWGARSSMIDAEVGPSRAIRDASVIPAPARAIPSAPMAAPSAVRGYLPGPTTALADTRGAQDLITNDPGVLLSGNFPVPNRVMEDLLAVSNDPFIADIAKRSGVREVAFDPPHTFELSQQGGVARGGRVRLNPDVEDAGNTLLHELGHIFWGRSSDSQQLELIDALQAAKTGGFKHYEGNPAEALAELFGFARDRPALQDMLAFTPAGKTFGELFPAQLASPNTLSAARTVRPWDEIKYLTQEHDLHEIVRQHGDRQVVIKDTNGGRHVVPASVAANMLDDQVVSGYVREVWPALRDEAGKEPPTRLNEHTLNDLPGLKEGMYRFMNKESPSLALARSKLEDAERELRSLREDKKDYIAEFGPDEWRSDVADAKKQLAVARTLLRKMTLKAGDARLPVAQTKALPTNPTLADVLGMPPSHPIGQTPHTSALPPPISTMAGPVQIERPFMPSAAFESQAAALARGSDVPRPAEIDWAGLEQRLPAISRELYDRPVPELTRKLMALMAHNALSRFGSQRN